MLRLSVAATLAATCLTAASSPAQTGRGVTLGTALPIAQRGAGTAQLVRARTEGPPTVFGFYFLDMTGMLVEIEISGTGDIIKNTKTDKDKVVSDDVRRLLEQSNGRRAKLPDGRLLEIMADNLKANGLDTNINFAALNGRLVLRSGNVAIDAETGKVVPVK